MKALFLSFIVFFSAAASASVDRVVVLKSQKVLMLIDKNDQVLKRYRIALGAEPIGHKTQEGDESTPEGRYTIDWLKEDSSFYRALHISYPNTQDKAQAKKRKVSAGGAIFIHGLPNEVQDMNIPKWAYPVHYMYNWTNGCIAVTNKEMDEIIDLVQINTPIFIFPY